MAEGPLAPPTEDGVPNASPNTGGGCGGGGGV